MPEPVPGKRDHLGPVSETLVWSRYFPMDLGEIVIVSGKSNGQEWLGKGGIRISWRGMEEIENPKPDSPGPRRDRFLETEFQVDRDY